MSLKQKISEDFKEAFKNKELEKKGVLSMVNSEIKNKEIELGKREKGLSDEEVVTVVQKAVKQRKDSVDQFKQGGRTDLAEAEQEEIEILQNYLPEQMSDEEIEEQISKIIEDAGAEGPADIGKVMGLAMGFLKGKADGNKVKQIVEKLLNKNG